MVKDTMKEVVLLPEESVVRRTDKVGDHAPMGIKNNGLILTNRALIYVKKGMLGKTKEVKRFPLDTIRTSAGKPEVHFSNPDHFTPTLDVYFDTGEESFKFDWDDEAREWADSITETITGEKVERNSGFFDLDDFGDVMKFAENISGATKMVKKAFGMKSTDQAACRCPSCSASLTGMEDETVQCPYCGTWVKL